MRYSVTAKDLPGLYQSADNASICAQKIYYRSLACYLILLILASYISYGYSGTTNGAILSASLFLITLGILIWLRVKRPDDVWYNGRAVAESVKTRAWRWMMRAEPYHDTKNIEIVSKEFINDLKAILNQNRSISTMLGSYAEIEDPITEKMKNIRALDINERLNIYKTERIQDQSEWYSKKAIYNKKRATFWFWCSVVLHSAAVFMLLLRIKNPAQSYPIEVIATAAGGTLTWLQAKKHNELSSSYALAAHELVLIKGEDLSVKTEKELSDFVVNSEAAFSREHTQWVARKND